MIVQKWPSSALEYAAGSLNERPPYYSPAAPFEDLKLCGMWFPITHSAPGIIPSTASAVVGRCLRNMLAP